VKNCGLRKIIEEHLSHFTVHKKAPQKAACCLLTLGTHSHLSQKSKIPKGSVHYKASRQTAAVNFSKDPTTTNSYK
jgi:hypothetical protein